MVIKNKKGQDLSIGTLILIVLGIVVLVLLILGFSIGWQNLWEKINIFGGGSSIGDVAIACGLSATQDNQYGYCQDFKKVKVAGKTEYLTCEDGRIQPTLDNTIRCNPQLVQNAITSLCAGLSDKDKLEAKINNGQTCNQLFPQGSGGRCSDITDVSGGTSKVAAWQVPACDTNTHRDVTPDVTDVSDKGTNTKCCLPL